MLPVGRKTFLDVATDRYAQSAYLNVCYAENTASASPEILLAGFNQAYNQR
jgi:hypothetical protein